MKTKKGQKGMELGGGVNERINEMKDCFAYKKNECIALKVKECQGCSFYKTKGQYLLDQEQALNRIRSLDAKKQKHIFEKYYKMEV